MPSSRKALFGLALIPLLLPLPGRAQERVVVSKEVAVGRSEATLRLEFSDGAGLSLSLKDGSVVVDGDVVGSYATGDALEAAWRALLGEAVALDDGPLSQRLRDWSPDCLRRLPGFMAANAVDFRIRVLDSSRKAERDEIKELKRELREMVG